jgi:hypothetical protein
MTLAEALKYAQALSVPERKELVKILVDSLGVPETEKTHSILEFAGMAAHLTDDEDPQDYINRIRAEWDEHP